MHHRIIGTIAALGIVLTSCSSEAAPDDQPTPTSHEADAVTAPKFIAHYVATGNDMQTSGDTTAFRALYTDDCAACEVHATLVENVYGGGGSFLSGDQEVLSITKGDGARRWIVDIRSSPIRFREQAGGPVREIAGSRDQIEFTLERAGDSWQVADFSKV